MLLVGAAARWDSFGQILDQGEALATPRRSGTIHSRAAFASLQPQPGRESDGEDEEDDQEGSASIQQGRREGPQGPFQGQDADRQYLEADEAVGPRTEGEGTPARHRALSCGGWPEDLSAKRSLQFAGVDFLVRKLLSRQVQPVLRLLQLPGDQDVVLEPDESARQFSARLHAALSH